MLFLIPFPSLHSHVLSAMPCQATSPCPVPALESINADVHLLEDLCFGPSWPQVGGVVALAWPVLRALSPLERQNV